MVCAGAEQAKEAVKRILVDNEFGPAGRRIIIEECLKGQEASVLVLTDGETIVPLVCAQDHKPIYDNDQGPNTGGMGAYAPAPIIDDRRLDKIIDIVFKPVIQGLKKEGKTYKGVLYGGMMIDGENINVLEFNVRFGDPETQVILPKLNGDLVDIMCKVTEGRLHQAAVSWDQGWCVCVVIAAGGYPGKYDKGKNISGLDYFAGKKDLFLFHAGTKLAPNQEKGAEALVTNGGRVLSAVALGDSLKSAQEKVYSAVKYIHFENMFYRKDIANKAL